MNWAPASGRGSREFLSSFLIVDYLPAMGWEGAGFLLGSSDTLPKTFMKSATRQVEQVRVGACWVSISGCTRIEQILGWVSRGTIPKVPPTWELRGLRGEAGEWRSTSLKVGIALPPT
jgi:hypothetical protein